MTNPHLINGDFQSDKYPTTPLGKVPLSTKDPMAQDLLKIYAERRRALDPEFSEAVEVALAGHGYAAAPSDALRKALDWLAGIEEHWEGEPVAQHAKTVRTALAVADAGDRRDARRWRALMASQRMHFTGSAGFDFGPDRNDPYPKPGRQLHFGMEFWDVHPATGDDKLERDLLTRYVDTLAVRIALVDEAREGGAVAVEALCEDCPRVGYPTDATRCAPCPRRAAPS